MRFNQKLSSGVRVAALMALFASCAPIAPSVEKGQIGLKQKSTVIDTQPVLTTDDKDPKIPADRVLIVKDSAGSWLYAGPKDVDWFYRWISKKNTLTTISIENPSMKDQLLAFQQKRSAYLPIMVKEPAAEKLDVAFYFEVAVSRTELTQEMLSKLDFRWKFAPKTGAHGAKAADWFIQIVDSDGDRDSEVETLFLKRLISITAATREK